MEEINEREYKWLIANGYLQCKRGKVNGLIKGTKGKSGKSKFTMIEKQLYNQLQRLYKVKNYK